MSEPQALRPRPDPLPAKMEEWTRALKSERSFNDKVEDIHRMLVDANDNEDYLNYLQAVYDDDAVTGATDIDDAYAAQMIIDKAKTTPGNEVAHKNVAQVRRALGVVLRRYKKSRAERREQAENGGAPATLEPR